MYAPCFFSPEVAAGRVRERSKSFGIGPPTFNSRGEPDPNERYIAKIKGGYFENKTLFLEFNSDGVITKGEASSENVAVDVLIGALKTGVSVAASVAGGGPAEVAARSVPADEADLKMAELTKEIRVCGATIVAEAALEAAAAAIAAAKASGNPNEMHAIAARDKAKDIKKNLAAKQKELADLLIQATEQNADLNTIISNLDVRATTLVDEVVCDAKAVRTEVLAAAAAAAAVAAAATEAQAAMDSANTITTVIDYFGVFDTAIPVPTRAGCYKQDETSLATKAFADGYDKAKQKFVRIKELKQNREELASGKQIPMGLSADAFQKMLDETDNTIKSYENTFFLGTTEENSWTADFEYRPGRTNHSHVYNTVQTSPILIWFSKTEGLCESTETTNQGVLIKPAFKAEDCSVPAPNRKGVWIGLQRLTDEHPFLYQMATANERDERNGERGFYYRIPAQAVAKLTLSPIAPANAATLDANSLQGQNWNPATPPPAGPLLIPAGTELVRNTMKVAQMGVIASIPASAAGRTTQYTIDFDESTGALKNFKLASNALLEKSIVEEAGAAASDIVTAKQAREKAKKEATDELTQKKRELELLKTENEINAEKKKLEAAQPSPTPNPQ